MAIIADEIRDCHFTLATAFCYGIVEDLPFHLTICVELFGIYCTYRARSKRAACDTKVSDTGLFGFPIVCRRIIDYVVESSGGGWPAYRRQSLMLLINRYDTGA